MAASFWHDFGTNVAASLAAGAVLLYATYRLVDSRLHLRERAEREEAERKARVDTREAVLAAVLTELEDDAARLQEWLKVLPKGHVPFPGFDTTGWPLISQAPVFITMSKDTITALTHAYNRMASTNDQRDFLADLTVGATATMTNAVLAEPLERNVELARKLADKVLDHQDGTRAMLVERLGDLKSALDTAIDAVEAELGRPGPVPAAQRNYEHEDSPMLRQLAAMEGDAEDTSPPSGSS